MMFVFSGALRFIRKIIGLKDEQYNLTIARNKLFVPIVDAFKANKRRYNLLNSALIELFEFIRQVNSVSISSSSLFVFFSRSSRKISKH
jgi:protein phosphatase-4 regulatory subunit 3